AVYPALLFVVGCGVLLFLIGYVVPRFSLVFEGVGSELPWLSRMLLTLGQFLHAHQAAVFGGLALALLASALLLLQSAVRRALVRRIERLTTIHERLFIHGMARFYRSLGILLQGGIPILGAIAMVRGLLGASSRVRLDRAAERIR